MEDNQHKLILKVDGEVTASDFRTVVDAFVDLVVALTLNQDPGSDLEWAVDDFRGGSAVITFRPLAETADSARLAAGIEQEYGYLAESAAQGHLDDYGPDVAEPVMRISGVLNGRIPKIQFATTHSEHDIVARIGPDEDVDAPQLAPLRFRDHVRTSLRGRITNLSDKKGLCFTLEEDRTGRQVRCYPPSKYRQVISKFWADASWILVEGTFMRYSDKGTLKDITDIVEVQGGRTVNWRDAIGCAPRATGREGESASDTVRKLRDG